VNFSLFSKSSTRIELLFFDRVDDSKPSSVIPLDPITNRTYHYWHVFVPDIQPGQICGTETRPGVQGALSASGGFIYTTRRC
jgi:glycogen operon protein